MDNNILVSIIVPVYKVEQYLVRCVTSLQNQTYKNIEILLVDDGSPDNSGKLCEELVQTDSRIRVFHKENGGLSDARNYGIERALGNYIVFVDSDDYVTDDYVQILLNACIKNNCKLAVCGFERTEEDTIANQHDYSEKVMPADDVLEQLCINNQDHVLFTVAWNKMYSRDLFEHIRFPKGILHEDEATTYRIVSDVDKVAVISKAMYGYYMSPQSIMRGGYNRKRLDILSILEDKVKYFSDRNKDKYALLTRMQMSNTIIYHYYNVKKYLEDSSELQKSLKNLFWNYCLNNSSEFPVFMKINNHLFYKFTHIYCMLFEVYQRIK